MEDTLAHIAQQALEQTGSASAAIFLVDPSGLLKLGAVAGLEGEPLDRLIAAVLSPDHPITRTAASGDAEFDMTPMAHGGPALRSHVPLADGSRTMGVLALAHQDPLTSEQRLAVVDLARRAAL